MRLTKKRAPSILECDWTPMIDVTFQLIAFFALIMNFAQTEQDDRVQLPKSVLAKPPDQPMEFPITLHLTRRGTVVYGGQEFTSLDRLRPYLVAEGEVLKGRGRTLNDATVIIRAHRDIPAGRVQELIQTCQNCNFEKFVLRAMEEQSR